MDYGTTRRPDPDRLLSAGRQEERKHEKGALTLFFGMAAGVGKTTAMLRAAQARKREGVDVVIGVLETHGRVEVMELAQGLEVIPLRVLSYRGMICRELNLNAVIHRRPQLVLVDELPHHNVPGCRHPYRWQDVIDLLDAKIDVYTTLNVQHVESRKEMVELITGITIRETVPDLMIERASEIQLVDIMPSELLQRLKEGRVYLGDKSILASQNFFQEDRLTALREVALRLTAEKVDHDLLAMQSADLGWRPTEKLLVVVAPTQHSQKAIRATRRFAFALKTTWIAAFIDTGLKLNDTEQKQLAENLRLARDLGAEVMTIVDPSITEAVKRLVEENAISQIILSRTSHRFSLYKINCYTLYESLMETIKSSDLHILAYDEDDEEESGRGQSLFHLGLDVFTWRAGFIVLALIGSGLFFWLQQTTAAIGLLLLILFTSFLHGSRGLFVSILLLLFAGGLISWWAFPPLMLTSWQDAVLVALLLVALVINAWLRHQLHARDSMLRRQSEESRVLYEVMHQIAIAPTQQVLLKAVSERLSKLLKGTVEILLVSDQQQLVSQVEWVVVESEKEHAVATWVLTHGKPAGWSTETLSAVGILCWPLRGTKDVVGVLAFRPERTALLTFGEVHVVDTITQQLSLYLERISYEERARQTAYMARADRFQDAIVQSVAEELTRPLHAMQNIIRQLPVDESLESRKVLVAELQAYLEELGRWLANLSELSLISSGFMEVHPERVHVEEWMRSVLHNVEKQASNHEVIVQIPLKLPDVYCDPTLMELVMTNVLLNAFDSTPHGKRVWITAEQADREIVLSVADEGKGIPSDSTEYVFEKFFRLPDTKSTGLGLGLSVAKAIVALHQGRIQVQNRVEGGARLTLFLPIDPIFL